MLLPQHEYEKRPCKPMFTGCVRGYGGCRECLWSLVWLFGCIMDVQGGVVAVLLPEHMRMKKVCKHQFTGYWVIAKTLCVA